MTPTYTKRRQYDKCVGIKFEAIDTTTMSKKDREEAVLSLLAEIGEPLPPVLIYRILRVRGATFGERSVHRYCADLGAAGDLRKIGPDAMADGELRELPPGESGYWMISEQGRKRIDN